MDFFLERFFEASRARWWQVVASVCIGAVFATAAAWDQDETIAHAAPFALGGAALGLLAALFLLWVDAAQRTRAARPDHPITLRERVLIACLIIGFALGGLSIVCMIIMGVIRVVEFFFKDAGT
jgi:hypothetical protein